MRYASRLALCGVLVMAQLPAQEPQLSIEKAHLPPPIRSYAPPIVPPVRLRNSARLHSLMRAGRLYLTAQDALALAIEDNLDLEVDRYGPLLADSALERTKAGGPIRGVPSASAQVASLDSGLGVNGSELSAGLINNNNGSAGGRGGAASIQQVGAITPNLDPVLQNTSTFAHLSQPQSTTIVSGTISLVETVHTYNTTLQQGLISGGLFQYTDYEQYLKENSPTDYLNPAVGPHMDLYLRHNLLQGFGVKLNNRFIRIAQTNTVASRETFRSQLVDLVTNVLILYWDVVSGQDDLKVRRLALEATEKFYSDTKKEVAAGAMPTVELPRAKSEAASRREDVIIAEAELEHREALLKDVLSRVPDPELDAAQIVTLDHIEIPDTDDLPPMRQLVTSALARRPDIAAAHYRDEVAKMALIGTENPLLPSLQPFVQTYDRGLAGTAQIVDGIGPSQYVVGGYGTALKQILRRNYPNEQAGVNFSIPLRNRQAQGDYGIDQLQYRQSQVSNMRDANQIVVDISNQISALRQSRARYAASRDTRILQEQLLESDRKKFSYGIATFNDIITDQRTLVTAQIGEIAARADYARARVSLDQVLGQTLESNHVSLDEGLRGRVALQSTVPPAAAETPQH